MIVNQKKLDRQLQIVDKWVKAGAKGTLEAVTAFGKTYTAILAIKRLHRKYPHAVINVVVPGRDLHDQWINPETGHIVKHGLHNINVFVVNTYIRYQHKCDLLILDEIHNYAADEFSRVFDQTEYQFILGLTATLERIDGRHQMIEELCPIIDTVSLMEAKREGYVADFHTFNWGLELSAEDREQYDKLHSIFNQCFAYFQHDFDLAMACSIGGSSEVRIQFAKRQGWDESVDHYYSPANVSRKAQQWRAAMSQRKKFIYTAGVKLDAIKKLVLKFPCKTMIFSENSEFADKVEAMIGTDRCRAYHTNLQTQIVTERIEKTSRKGEVIVTYKEKKLGKDKLKKLILESFSKKDGIPILSTVKALDEGYDNDLIEMAIMASYSSAKRQDTQRSGRGIRVNPFDEGKVSLLINLYIKGTQEEKWLKEKQRGKEGIVWVDSISQINRNSDEGINL